MGQGQLTVVIYIHFVEFESLMLHARFQDHMTSCSGEEDFLKMFTIYGHGGYLGHVTCPIYINFLTFQGGSTRNLAMIGQAVSEKKFENNGHYVYTCI